MGLPFKRSRSVCKPFLMQFALISKLCTALFLGISDYKVQKKVDNVHVQAIDAENKKNTSQSAREVLNEYQKSKIVGIQK